MREGDGDDMEDQGDMTTEREATKWDELERRATMVSEEGE